MLCSCTLTMKYQIKKLRKQPPFDCNKMIKYLEINLSEEVTDLYSENCKTLMKETEDDTNKWKDIPCSQIRGVNIVKMAILPKATCRFNAIFIKIPMAIFIEQEQINLKFVWKCKRS